ANVLDSHYSFIVLCVVLLYFFFSSRRRHTRSYGDWSSDVCSSDLLPCRSTMRSEPPEATVPTHPSPAVTTTSRLASAGSSGLWKIGRASCRERGGVGGGGGAVEEEREARVRRGRETRKCVRVISV